ncbi:MAG: hypothetical protein ACFFD2_12305 [Promethearchaeota archaeon]
MMFFKECEMKFKNEIGEISKSYQESFIKEIEKYRSVCESALIK